MYSNAICVILKMISNEVLLIRSKSGPLIPDIAFWFPFDENYTFIFSYIKFATCIKCIQMQFALF